MRRRAWTPATIALLGAAAFAACTGDDPVIAPNAPDGAANDGPGLDAAGGDATGKPDGNAEASAPRCDPAKAFDAPSLVANLPSGTASDTFGRLALDETLIVFATNRGSAPLYFATRLRKEDPFGAPTKLAVNTTELLGSPTMTNNGLTLVVDATSGVTPSNIAEATRGDTSVGFAAPATVTNVTSLPPSSQPYISPDGQRMVYSVSGQLKESTRQGGTFGMGIPIAGIDGDAGNGNGAPVMSADGLVLYFASQRDGATTLDIWVATRATRALGFDPPRMVTELSSATARDLPSWISDDLCRIYFHSNRNVDPDASSPPNQIYFASRKP